MELISGIFLLCFAHALLVARNHAGINPPRFRFHFGAIVAFETVTAHTLAVGTETVVRAIVGAHPVAALGPREASLALANPIDTKALIGATTRAEHLLTTRTGIERLAPGNCLVAHAVPDVGVACPITVAISWAVRNLGFAAFAFVAGVARARAA